MEMSVTDLNQGIRKVTLVGRLDIEGTGEIELKFGGYTAAAKKPVIVDFTEVSFLASIGMRLLVTNAKALNDAGQKLVILNPQGIVRKTLETAGIESFIPIAETEDAAIMAVTS